MRTPEHGNYPKPQLELLQPPSSIILKEWPQLIRDKLAKEKQLWTHNDSLFVAHQEDRISVGSFPYEKIKPVVENVVITRGAYSFYERKNGFFNSAIRFVKNGNDVVVLGADVCEYFPFGIAKNTTSKVLEQHHTKIDRKENRDGNCFNGWFGTVEIKKFEYDEHNLYEHSTKQYEPYVFPTEKTSKEIDEVLEKAAVQMQLLVGERKNVYLGDDKTVLQKIFKLEL